ncbi:GP32 family protein [Burkholderia pseudomallei]|nr:GP32 family protein [Burkholderia pseudomallei]CAJ3196455.1 GP32 family protein [Burkholderia pseudomallei]CAJ4462089.1 GP32 family protein [Burkholderia pseudomallei]CAJ4632672.1 GP32 family protein [Burkholderia pseudomallei]CAJ4682268.1 GP32 family protein [Burkholderia pseudomallei]
MILPPFNPPKLPEMTEWWTRCTYADVQRLILEVQHQRLTLWELRSCITDASRRARAIDPSLLEYGAPLRRLGYIVEKEIDRATPFARMREPVAPFSDEWRAREELKSKRWESPDDAPPGASPKSIRNFSG